MENKEIFILGIGHNTIVYIDLVEACGYKVAGLYHYNDERTGEFIHGYPIIDSNNNLFNSKTLEGKSFAISVGNNKIRCQLAGEIRNRGGKVPRIIHPTAVVSKHAYIEEGVVIHINSVIQGDTIIRKDSVLSYNSSVTHTSEIGEGCYLAAYAHVGAYVNIGNNVLLGQGSIIVSSKVKYIGDNSIVGAGTVVINSFEDKSVIAGNPGRLIKILE